MFDFWGKNKTQKIASYLQKANRLYEQRQYAQAAKLYQKILCLDSEHFAATANLAVSYFELEEYAKAVLYFHRTIKSDSSNPWWHNYLSQSYQKTSQYQEAIDEAWQAVCLSNGQDEHQLNLAYAIYETATEKGRDFTDSILEKWYRSYPQSGIAKQSYNAFYPDENFNRSDSEYVEKLFDTFAADFDAVLAELEYDSPQYIADSLAFVWAAKTDDKKRILDLGCGSGLCGKFVRKIFPESQIWGIDISANMLQEADKKNVYSELLKSDIDDCFYLIKHKFDAVVSADVFTYFGALDSVFFHVADSLYPQGVFAFTISQNTFNQKPYFLTPSSRFVHNDKYIEQLLETNGFNLLKKEKKVLRKEGEKDVIGWVFLSIKK